MKKSSRKPMAVDMTHNTIFFAFVNIQKLIATGILKSF
jgi:hypothetical protein